MSDRRPTPEEVAAIVAAVEAVWPDPPPAPPPAARTRPGWRFSGRWWAPDAPGGATRTPRRSK